MGKKKTLGLIVLACFCMTAAGGPLSFGRGAVQRAVSAGKWGGEQIEMVVGRGGTRIEYDCGGGTIDGPLRPDRAGRFSAKGTLVVGHGGPARIDEQPDSRPARYTGRVTGKTMTLTVTLAGTGESVGTFTLRHGRDGRLRRCL